MATINVFQTTAEEPEVNVNASTSSDNSLDGFTPYDNVTPCYVNLLTSKKWATRTADSEEFCQLKSMLSVYLNPNINAVPGKKYTHGLSLLIAHFYALDDTVAPDSGGSGGTVGSITSESVGDVSFSYGGVPTSGGVAGWKTWLTQTTWGTQFLYLWKTFKSTPLVTG